MSILSTFQIRKLAGLKVDTLGLTSELLGDFEKCAVSLDLSVPNSKMRRLDQSPPGSFLYQEPTDRGRRGFLA